MGGDMEIESEVNKGTTAKFWIKTQSEEAEEKLPIINLKSITSMPSELEYPSHDPDINTKIGHYANAYNMNTPVIIPNIIYYILYNLYFIFYILYFIFYIL